MREFGFEMALCARLERRSDRIVARQLGGGVDAPANRVLDVVCVEPGPEFDDRAAITPRSIPTAAIEAEVGPGRARYWKGAFDCHPERARTAVDRAVEVGFFERERRGGREYVRQTARYPDWIGSITAIENKPDLDAPGDLDLQLRKDVSLGLVDRAVLATGSYVTRAHLNRIPEEVGVWRFRGDEIEEIRDPTPLSPGRPGVEVLERRPLRTDVRIASVEEKRRARRRLAERAYGKGWRPALPACAEAENATATGASGVPYCAWKERIVDPGGCGPSCPGHDPAEPPATDAAAERDARTPWVTDPEGRARRQAGLDRFQ